MATFEVTKLKKQVANSVDPDETVSYGYDGLIWIYTVCKAPIFPVCYFERVSAGFVALLVFKIYLLNAYLTLKETDDINPRPDCGHLLRFLYEQIAVLLDKKKSYVEQT